MRRNAAVLVACSLISTASIDSAICAACQAPADALVAGRVISRSDGSPISDATVTLTPERPDRPLAGLPQSVITDPAGRFVFTAVPKARLLLRAIKSGYVPDELDSALVLDMTDASGMTTAELRLTRGASVGGLVTDDLGDPVVGVAVRAQRRVYYEGRLGYEEGSVGRTDDRGTYRLAGLAPGEYIVSVPATHVTVPLETMRRHMRFDGDVGREATWAMLRVTSQISELGDIGAQRFGDVVVQSPAGTFYPPDPADLDRAWAYQTTFAPSTSVLADAQVVAVQSGGHSGGVDVTLILRPTVTLAGRVQSRDGAVGGAVLRLLGAGSQFSDDFAAAVALADASGVFTFVNVAPGQYLLRAAAGNGQDRFLWAEEAVAVGDRPIANVEIALRRAVNIRGRIEFSGTRAGPSGDELRRLQEREAVVRVQAADGRLRERFYSVDVGGSGLFAAKVDGGRYLVSGTQIGPWVLHSAMLDGRDVSQVPLEIGDGDVSGIVLSFSDRPTRIVGTVRGRGTISGRSATVLLFPADEMTWRDGGSAGRRFWLTNSSASGVYALTGAPAGDYWLVAVIEEPSATEAVDVPGSLSDWMNPTFLTAASGWGTRIRLTDREARTVDLTARVIR